LDLPHLPSLPSSPLHQRLPQSFAEACLMGGGGVSFFMCSAASSLLTSLMYENGAVVCLVHAMMCLVHAMMCHVGAPSPCPQHAPPVRAPCVCRSPRGSHLNLIGCHASPPTPQNAASCCGCLCGYMGGAPLFVVRCTVTIRSVRRTRRVRVCPHPVSTCLYICKPTAYALTA